jgi:hypothetical protein
VAIDFETTPDDVYVVYPGRGLLTHDDPGFEPTMTIASRVFDLKHDVMHVAAGQPTQSEYQAVRLPDATALKVTRAR